jgi:hypothetical protein
MAPNLLKSAQICSTLTLFLRNTYTHICNTPIHLHTYTPTHLHTYTPIHLHTYTPTHLHTHTPIHLHTYTPTHPHTYTPIYLCDRQPDLLRPLRLRVPGQLRGLPQLQVGVGVLNPLNIYYNVY